MASTTHSKHNTNYEDSIAMSVDSDKLKNVDGRIMLRSDDDMFKSLKNGGRFVMNNTDEDLLQKPTQKEDDDWGREHNCKSETINSTYYVP